MQKNHQMMHNYQLSLSVPEPTKKFTKIHGWAIQLEHKIISIYKCIGIKWDITTKNNQSRDATVFFDAEIQWFQTNNQHGVIFYLHKSQLNCDNGNSAMQPNPSSGSTHRCLTLWCFLKIMYQNKNLVKPRVWANQPGTSKVKDN